MYNRFLLGMTVKIRQPSTEKNRQRYIKILYL
jgi:hypothetical protein